MDFRRVSRLFADPDWDGEIEQDEDYVKRLSEMFGDDSPFFEPDDLSDRIIKSYQRHLRGLKKKMQG